MRSHRTKGHFASLETRDSSKWLVISCFSLRLIFILLQLSEIKRASAKVGGREEGQDTALLLYLKKTPVHSPGLRHLLPVGREQERQTQSLHTD